jgi:hydrogenase maturation protease
VRGEAVQDGLPSPSATPGSPHLDSGPDLRQAASPSCQTILILGLGNVLRSDDGIGVHAVRELQRNPLPGARPIEIGTGILHALSFLETAGRVLVIDAAHGGQPPGTLYLFDAANPPALQPGASLHAVGVREALRLLPAGHIPPRLTVLGVEPASLDYGMELSPLLQAALPRVVALARETITAWLNEPQPTPRLCSALEPVPV